MARSNVFVRVMFQSSSSQLTAGKGYIIFGGHQSLLSDASCFSSNEWRLCQSTTKFVLKISFVFRVKKYLFPELKPDNILGA